MAFSTVTYIPLLLVAFGFIGFQLPFIGYGIWTLTAFTLVTISSVSVGTNTTSYGHNV